MLDLSLETESKEEHEALLGDKHMVISMGKSYLNAENETQNSFLCLVFCVYHLTFHKVLTQNVN